MTFARAAFLVFAATFMLTGCGKPAAAPSAPAGPPPAVTVVNPVVRPVTEMLEFPGRTAAVESVEVRARVGGYLLKVAFKDGAEVKKGDLLFQIDPATYRAALDQAQATLASTLAKLHTQEIELARYRALVAKGGISRQLADQAEGSRNETAAQRQALQATVERARLDLEYTRITAPIAGLMSRTRVTPGNLVTANQTVLTSIVMPDPIYAYFDVDEATVLRVRKLIKERKVTSYREARFPVFLGLASEDGFPHEGSIDFTDNQLDPGTGTLPVRGSFPNPGRALSPGLFARIRFPLGSPRGAVLIPERALNMDQRGEFVKVVGKGDVVADRLVKSGRTDGPMIVIERGLAAEDRVIVSGLQKAKAGGKVSAKLEDAGLLIAADTK